MRAAVRAGGDEKRAVTLMHWSTTDELLLSICNRIADNTWVTAQAVSPKKIRKPEPVYGPLGKPTRRGTGDASALARSLLAQQKG